MTAPKSAPDDPATAELAETPDPAPTPVRADEPRELVECDDGRLRPRWAARDPLVRDYHDTEWGRPVESERDLFEMQSLFVFQVGLRWGVVLRRRAALRELFDNFEAGLVARFETARIDAITGDPRAIRNRAKVAAVVRNAGATVRLTEEGSGLLAHVQQHLLATRPSGAEGHGLAATRRVQADMARAGALASDLLGRGFTFLGPGNTYAMLQAAGLLTSPGNGAGRLAPGGDG